MFPAMWHLPLFAAISWQIRRVPGVHAIVSQLWLACSAAWSFTFMLPGMTLATATYRLDRDPQITQAITDMFWLVALMPQPTFMIQNFAFAYAIILDRRPRRAFPRYVAVINIIVPILFVPGTALHTTDFGPLAWNGAWYS
jgi:hypothetical protein